MTEPNDGAFCRICGSSKIHEYYLSSGLFQKLDINLALRPGGYLNELIRPCECRGEFAYAHRPCLADWIETTKHEYCDICRFRYNIKVYDRSIFDWISETDQVERLLKSSCLALLIIYLSCLGLLFESAVSSPTVLDRFIFITSCSWLVACLIGTIVLCVELYRELREWKECNKRVLVEPNLNPQLDVTTRPKDILKSSGFKR